MRLLYGQPLDYAEKRFLMKSLLAGCHSGEESRMASEICGKLGLSEELSQLLTEEQDRSRRAAASSMVSAMGV